MDNLALYILDLVQNSIEAKANYIKVELKEDQHLCLIIQDDGCGMSEETLKQAISPFYTTRKTRKVGMGLSLIKMLTEQTEGNFEINSALGLGTTLNACFNHQHIDMPPLGNLGEMVMMIAINSNVKHFVFEYIKGQQSYQFDLDTMKAMFQESLMEHQIMQGLIEYINQEIHIVRGRV
jgi:signal transduction histidine kinase